MAIYHVEDIQKHVEQAVEKQTSRMDKHQSQLKKELFSKTRELEKATKRLADLDKLFRKAFEEMTLGNLSEQQFKMLTQAYEGEKP